MKKTIKKVLLALVSLILVLVLAVSALLFWYYPRFTGKRRTVTVPAGDGAESKLMSYNLRCITPLDVGKKNWFYRADHILSDIEKEAPGIIGFQEATVWQYNFLVESLPDYDSVITYRDDAFNSEGCPIFYHTLRYTLVEKGSFWLSETPETMSRDWGAACYRITSYVILTDNFSGKDFVVFNTHLDHVSDEARIKGMEVILQKIAQFGGLPAVIMGDLNAEEDSATIAAATEHFLDARYAAPDTVDTYTFQNWGNFAEAVRIDYFMISKTGIKPLQYRVLDQPHGDVWPSDHSSIVLTLELE